MKKPHSSTTRVYWSIVYKRIKRGEYITVDNFQSQEEVDTETERLLKSGVYNLRTVFKEEKIKTYFGDIGDTKTLLRPFEGEQE